MLRSALYVVTMGNVETCEEEMVSALIPIPSVLLFSSSEKLPAILPQSRTGAPAGRSGVVIEITELGPENGYSQCN